MGAGGQVLPILQQWRAHDCVRGLAALRAKRGVVSVGFDRTVRIWALDGQILGTLRQGDAIQEEWLFEPAAEEKLKALRLEAAEVMGQIAEEDAAAEAEEVGWTLGSQTLGSATLGSRRNLSETSAQWGESRA